VLRKIILRRFNGLLKEYRNTLKNMIHMKGVGVMGSRKCFNIQSCVLLFSVIFLLFASTAIAAPKIAVYAYHSEPYIDLDPSVEYSNGIIPLQNVYETLTRYNARTKKIEPLLATKWVASSDGLKWTFTIRSGVKFHDGTNLTAKIVKDSIERTMRLKKSASYIWDAVKAIDTPNNTTVVFTLKNPSPMDLICSASYAAFIMSPESMKMDSSWFNSGKDGGSGPYSIAKVQKGEQIILKAFKDYWGGWKPDQFDGVIIKKYAESSARRQLVEKGEAQITEGLSATDLNALSKNPNVVVHADPAWKNAIAFWNTQKSPLDNVNLRRALCYAYPYDEVVKNVLDGRAKKASGLVPVGLWGHSDKLGAPKFDIAKAKKYLALSGVDPKKCKFEVTFTSGYEEYRSAMQIYKTNLKKLGIDLNIHEMTWDSEWERSKNKNPKDRQDLLIMNWWPDYPSPLSWFYTLMHSEKNISFNLSYINNPKIDKLIEEADTKTVVNRKEAENIFINLQEIAIDQAYFINMFDREACWVVNKNVKGFYNNPAYETVVFFYDLRTK